MKKNSLAFETSLLHRCKDLSKIFINKWFIFLLPVLFATGCKKVNEETGIIGVCPIVIATNPADGATAVALNKKIDATFNEAMNATTITTATFTVKAGTTAVPGTVAYTGTIATFTPTVSLEPTTKYTATIAAGVKDPAGNAMINDYVWSFTTGVAPDVTPPTVLSVDPINLATGVLVDKKITATFSEAMNSLTITNTTFTLKQGATSILGTVTYSGTTATFSPTVVLAYSTVYTATITTGAQDLAANGLAANYVWSFTTGPAPDITRPTVTSTDPVNLALGVALNKIITATFSEAMTPTTINTLTFLVRQGVTLVNGSVTYTGLVATFTPTANLANNTVYTATITTGAKDLAGNALLVDYVWSFTTLQVIVPPPALGTISGFGAFGGGAGITNQGINTVINNGGIATTGVSTVITGFHDGITNDIYTETPLNVGLVNGRIHTAPPPPGSAASFVIATQALADANVAYLSISPASKPLSNDPGAELGGLTLAPGVYKSAGGTFNITNGNLTLDAMGDPNAVWIFQSAAALTVGIAGPTGAKSVILLNGAQAKNVFWYVGSAATINGAGGGVMVGTIIASAGVTFSTAGNLVQTVLNGRAISLVASVTMVNTTINVPN